MTSYAHIAWAIVNSIWQSGAIALAAWLLVRIIPRASAALRYAVWGAVLAGAAVLPVVDFVSPARIVVVEPAQSAPAPAQPTDARGSSHILFVTPSAPVPRVRTAVHNGGAISDARAPSPANAARTSVQANVGSTVQPIRSAPITAGTASVVAQPNLARRWSGAIWSWLPSAAPDRVWSAAIARSEPLAPVIVWCWGIAAALMLVRLGVGFSRLRTIKRGLVRVEHPAIASACLSTRRRVTVAASADVDCPCVIGYLRPVVALPSTLLHDLDGDDLSRVLAHELGHVLRYDDWANLVQQFVRAICCFNPVVHVACRALDVDREIACDDLVAARRADRIEYAKCLTEIARRTTFAEHLVPAAGFFPDRRQIIVRIEQLLDRNHAGSVRVGMVPVVATALVVASIAILGAHQVPAYAVAAAHPLKTPTPSIHRQRPSTAAGERSTPAANAIAVSPSVVDTIVVVTAPYQRANALVQRARSLLTRSTVAPNPETLAIAALGARSVALESRTPEARSFMSRYVANVPELSMRRALSMRMEALASAAPSSQASSADDFLDALTQAGYTHLSIDDLISIRNAGVTTEYLRALKQYGIAPMPASQLIALANAGVMVDFLKAMHDAGYSNLDAADYIRLANTGVSARYVNEISRSGWPLPSVDELTALANAGVSPDYISAMARYGYTHVSIGSLTRLANAGVTPDYVHALMSSGYSHLSVDSMIALANAGVSASYVTDMAKVGYRSMSVDTLVALANAGVKPSYIKSLADLGYKSLSTDDLIRLMNAGVTADMIKSLRAHGMGDHGPLSVDELINLANNGL